jgi:protein-L-isoaspartate(D-aspartate) O-methyltransferase
MSENMEKLIEELVDDGYLKTPEIIAAFYKVRRRHFLPSKLLDDEAYNSPLPIGYGQTISQPLTVAFMLELLQPESGDKVLDVGSGSGWQTALLAELAGKKGKVHGIERIPDLKKFGEENLKKYGHPNVELFLGDGAKGLPEHAPFDKIIVAAASDDIPQPLIDQLKVGGRLVIPVGHALQDMILIKKINEEEVEQTKYPGFAFVPLITDRNTQKED